MLNRILSAQTAATSGQDCWGLNFGSNNLADDAVGNLTSMSTWKCSGPSLSVSVNGKNQITNTGFSYDSDGNMTADGTNTYAFNAENQITSAAGATYTYGALGHRVEKQVSGTTTEYIWFDGNTVAEHNPTTGDWTDYVFFAGRRIAWRDASGNVHYMFADALGSTRVVTNSSGSTCFEADYYPYGQENDYSTSCPPTYKFTGCEFDSETGNYYAYARYYDLDIGRFLSADPLGGSVSNPQSLNRYTYVLNNPETFTDPSGACGIAFGGRICMPPPPPTNGGLDRYGCDEFDWIDPNSFCNEYIANWNNPDWIPGGQSFEVTVGGVAYHGTYYNVDEYFSWLADVESSPEARAYRQFMNDAAHANDQLDPNAWYPVTVGTTTAGMVTNVTLRNVGGVNVGSLAGGWPDPFTFFENGNASWGSSTLFGMEHTIAGPGPGAVTSHGDPFGWLNPLHYIVQLPLGNVGVNSQTWWCSVNGGCVQ